MTTRNLMFEDICQFLFIHTLTRIGDGDLHSVFVIYTLDGDGSSLGSKLPCIVSQGVDHKERKGLVCFHHILRRIDNKIHTFQLERHPPF